ncbi:hypothetical protein LCGC14_1506120 [marine sediment metagenome]|uniref:Uncharacterized protein n=1 Tax=marine sediment metagenome TaxID=412755 RepID=A0A0F9M414_9ZZZZ
MYKTDQWELKYFEDEDAIEIIVREDDGRITNGFASIPCYGEDDVSYDDQWEIARLLVAAPKLLEALENIENDANSIPEIIWNMRNNAIAMAKGN